MKWNIPFDQSTGVALVFLRGEEAATEEIGNAANHSTNNDWITNFSSTGTQSTEQSCH